MRRALGAIADATLQTSIGLTVLALLSLLAGCATSPDPCAGWAPIRPEAADVDGMSDELALQILQHNEHGSQACGWRP